MMKKEVRLWLSDFWPGFFHGTPPQSGSSFFKMLEQRFELVVDEENPDFLIYSGFGASFRRYSCPRIFYTGESVVPDRAECDFAFSHAQNVAGFNYHLPLYTVMSDTPALAAQPRNNAAADKTRFCNFVYTNPDCKERNTFFQLLSKYKKVDAGGKLFNNTSELLNMKGGNSPAKRRWAVKYKFSIVFENTSMPGYTTEKIADAFAANTVPIYWGNPEIEREFNRAAFVNCHRFNGFEEVMQKVIEIDNDDDLWAAYANAPIFRGGALPDCANPEKALDCFENFFNSPPQRPVAQTAYMKMLRHAPEHAANTIIKRRRAYLKRLYLQRHAGKK